MSSNNGSSDLTDYTIIVSSGKRYEIDLAKELAIDYERINFELSRQPGKFAWFSTLCDLAKTVKNNREQDLELVYSRLDRRLRIRWPNPKISRTEIALKNAILRHKEYREALVAYNEASEQLGKMYSAKEAFQQRKDMLMSISANRRKSLEEEV